MMVHMEHDNMSSKSLVETIVGNQNNSRPRKKMLSTNCHYFSLKVVLLSLFIVVLTLSNNFDFVSGETFNVYSWGLNLDGQTGLDYPTPNGFTFSYYTPLVNNYMTSILFQNSNALYESIYNIPTKPSEIQISLNSIIPGLQFNMYWLTFTNSSSGESVDQLFSCGDNSNSCAGLRGPKFTTELQVLYEYSYISFRRVTEGTIPNKRLHSVDCMGSCIACTKDGFVYTKPVNQYFWNSVEIPSGLIDSLGFNVSNKCEKVSIGGTTSDTFFVMTQSGHVFSWGDYNYGMRGYEDLENSGASPYLVSSIFGAYEIGALKNYDNPVPAGLGVLVFLNETGLFVIGKNRYVKYSMNIVYNITLT